MAAPRRAMAGLAVLATILLAAAAAQGRGLAVTLRASEAAGAPISGTVDLYRASHALVIGIDNYTNGWPRLGKAVEDARVVAAELRRRGFSVTLKTDLGADALRAALREFFAIKGEDPEARLLLWYAGHGHTMDGEGFLVPADAPPPTDRAFLVKALHMRDFGGLVRLAQSKHVLSVFDICFSGTIFTARAGAAPAAITLKTALPVRQFLTSGDAGQQVRDDGSFRELFVRAIRGDERADFNDDGYVTGDELGLFLSQRMAALTSAAQTPRYGKLQDVKFDQGDFVFAVAKAAAAAGTKPGAAAPSARIDGKALELSFWESIKDSRDADSFKAYLEQFPNGTFASLARLRLEKLRKARVAVVAPPKPKAPAPAKPVVGVFPKKPGETFKDCAQCPEMVVVPAGSFRMGDLSGGGAKDEKPVHRVSIPRPFALGKYEVTLAEFAAFVRDAGYGAGGGCFVYTGSKWEKQASRSWRDPGFAQTERDPVACVNWDDAKAYAAWLSKKTGKRYRLPSESEWEYAARAGTTTVRFWGDDADAACAHANVHDRKSKSVNGFSWKHHGCDDGYAQTAPVGSFRANDFGLHDVLGNLWEWVEDCWNESYAGAPGDGAAWTTGTCRRRVLRGGAWFNRPWLVRAAIRIVIDSDRRNGYVGFRVARIF